MLRYLRQGRTSMSEHGCYSLLFKYYGECIPPGVLTHSLALASGLGCSFAGARGQGEDHLLYECCAKLVRHSYVGLTTLDAGYDFGIVPDWLVHQRIQNPVYDWPLNPFSDDAERRHHLTGRPNTARHSMLPPAANAVP